MFMYTVCNNRHFLLVQMTTLWLLRQIVHWRAKYNITEANTTSVVSDAAHKSNTRTEPQYKGKQ